MNANVSSSLATAPRLPSCCHYEGSPDRIFGFVQFATPARCMGEIAVRGELETSIADLAIGLGGRAKPAPRVRRFAEQTGSPPRSMAAKPIINGLPDRVAACVALSIRRLAEMTWPAPSSAMARPSPVIASVHVSAWLVARAVSSSAMSATRSPAPEKLAARTSPLAPPSAPSGSSSARARRTASSP